MVRDDQTARIRASTLIVLWEALWSERSKQHTLGSQDVHLLNSMMQMSRVPDTLFIMGQLCMVEYVIKYSIYAKCRRLCVIFRGRFVI